MNNRSALPKTCDEAAFALLLESLAESWGAAALAENDRLKSDPAAAMPKVLQKRCRSCIRKAFSQEHQPRRVPFPWRAARRVAIAAVLLAALLSVSFVSSPTMRANVMNLALETPGADSALSFGQKAPDHPGLSRLVLLY